MSNVWGMCQFIQRKGENIIAESSLCKSTSSYCCSVFDGSRRNSSEVKGFVVFITGSLDKSESKLVLLFLS